jgi:hypothetical protein
MFEGKLDPAENLHGGEIVPALTRLVSEKIGVQPFEQGDLHEAVRF